MKYLLCLCGAAVLGLAFVGLFRLTLPHPKHPVTGKYFSRLAALTLAVLCLTFFWTYDNAMTLTAQMTSVGDTAEMFFFSGDDELIGSSTAYNETGTVEFALPGTSGLTLSRLDPVTGEGDLYLTGMQLNLFGVQLEEFTPERLYDGLNSGNIPVLDLTKKGIHFVTEDNDPICILPGEITADLNGYLRVYSVLTLVGSAALGLLVGWLMAGKRTQAFFERCAASARVLCRRYDISPNAMVIACVHFMFCFYIQHTNFPFEMRLLKKIVFYVCLFFVLLQVIWQVIFRTAERVRQRDRATLDFLKFSGIYFCIMFAFLLLIWPGYMSPDDYVMLWRSIHWDVLADYHFIVQDSMVLMQMLIPGAAGVELGFDLMISLVVGYVFREIYYRFGKTKWIYLLYIPMAFPAALLNNFQWEKSTFGTYLEILLLCKVTCAVLDGRKLNKKDIIEWVILTAITFTLRADGIYYILAAPVIFVLIFRKKASRSMLAALAVGIVICCGLFQTIQNSNSFDSFYKVVNFARLGYAPIKEADKTKDKDEIAQLRRFFDVDEYASAGSVNAAAGMATAGNSLSDTVNGPSKFSSIVVRLIVKHPFAYLAQQAERFLLSSGFDMVLDSSLTDIFGFNYQDPDTNKWPQELYENVCGKDVDVNPLNKPFSQKLRLKTILFCMGRGLDDFRIASVRNFLFNNLVPGILFLLTLWVGFLVKKKYALLGVLTLFLIRFFILFGTAPYVSFQYYLRFFVVGNVIPFFFLVRYLSRKEEIHLAEKE